MKTRPIQFSILFLFGLIFCASTVAGVIHSFRDTIAHDVSRHESAFRNTPDDATNIDYFIPGAFGPNTFIEFDCSESSFLDWVKRYPNVRPVTKRPYQMRAYENYSTWKRDEVEIVDGHVFEWTFEDQGRYIGYDNTTGRAYYWHHSR